MLKNLLENSFTYTSIYFEIIFLNRNEKKERKKPYKISANTPQKSKF